MTAAVSPAPHTRPPGTRNASTKPWRNWARNQECVPTAIEHPSSENELVAIIERAAAERRRVKAVGAGHSFTSTACTDGYLLDLTHYNRVVAVDREQHRVTVESGITLAALNEALAHFGLAMTNLGDIAYQSIAGAISTATHGTGAKFGNISSQVAGLRLVDGSGKVVDCTADRNPELFAAGRVGVGALGLISQVTIQAVPAFQIHAVEVTRRVDELLADLDEHIDGNDHFEFFWFPGTEWALTKFNRRTDEPARPRGKFVEWLGDEFLSNTVFGALSRTGARWAPAATALRAAIPRIGRTIYTDRSDRVFASPRRVKFVEMEYAVPREAFPEAFARVRELVDSVGRPITFPVECRWVAADDIPLSPASGRATAYIAVHVPKGRPYDQYFAGVEAIANDYGGRPHWGKLHYQTAETLPTRYPRWDEFQAARRQLDPDGRFANPYTDRVLGPPPNS